MPEEEKKPIITGRLRAIKQPMCGEVPGTNKLLVDEGIHHKGTEEVIAMEEVEEQNGAIRVDGGREGLTDLAEGNPRWLILRLPPTFFNVFRSISVLIRLDLRLTLKYKLLLL